MRGVGTILARELRGYFNSVIAYIYIVVFLLVSCGLFMTTFFLQGLVEMRSFFGVLPMVLLVFLPAVTMRLWAEERVLKTDELLLTCPLSIRVFVVGKFLAAFIFYLCVLAGTLTIPIMLGWLGDLDGGAVAAGYLGAVLLGAFLLALGLLISGFARDQIVAFVLSLAVGFALFLQGTETVAALLDGWVPGLGTFLQRALGLAWRFEDFARGVVSLQAVFFFLAGTVLFLALNILFVERRGRSCREPAFLGGVALLVAVAVLAVLVVSTFRGARLDWTEDNVFTVSDSTKTVLSQLRDRVRVTYYVSPEDKMPTGLKQLGRDVEDKLAELAASSKGRLEFQILDPTDPEVQEKAEEVRVEPFQVQSIERDEMTVKLVYSSIVLSYLDKDELMPQVHPGNFPALEYELVSRVYRLLQEEPATVAFHGAVETMDPQMAQAYRQMGRPVPPPRPIYNQVQQLLTQAGRYQVRPVDLTAGDTPPDEARTLVVLEPRSLSEDAVGTIAAFLRSGGNVILAVQERLFNYLPAGREGLQITPENLDTGLGGLLSHYGLRIAGDILMDREMEMLNIPRRQRVGHLEMNVSTPVRAPMQIHVVSKNVDRSAPAVGQIASLLYLWGSGIEIDEERLEELDLKHDVLFTSTDGAWYIPPGGPLTPSDIDPEIHDSAGAVPLAVLVRGRFPATPWDPEEAAAEESEEETAEAEAEAGQDDEPGEGRLLLVGSARMFSDGLVGAFDNALLLLNAVDTLTLGSELVDIRGKSLKPRSLETPAAAGKVWWRFFTVVLVPLLVVAAGAVRLLVRRRARERYRRDVLARAA